MDKTEILTPGPEMDEAVGKIMDATPKIVWWAMDQEEDGIFLRFTDLNIANNWLDDIKCHMMPNSIYNGVHLVRKEIYPRYSEDISAAWKVIQWIKPNYWVQVTESRKCAACEVGEYGSNGAVAVGRGKEAPEAICRLALIMDAKKPLLQTEAQREITHLNCTIDPEKVESFKSQWNSIDLSKIESLADFPLVKRGPDCEICKCFNCGELIECHHTRPSALYHCGSLCKGLLPIKECKIFDREDEVDD